MPQQLPVTDVASSLQAELSELSAKGAQRVDPVRFRYLESLADRLAEVPPSVSRILAERLSVEVGQYRARLGPAEAVVSASEANEPLRPFASVFAQRRAAAARGGRPVAAAERSAGSEPMNALTPLAALNQHISQAIRPGTNGADVARADVSNGALPVAGCGVAEWVPGAARGHSVGLKSARRFGETWSRQQSVNLVEQAIQNGPENAGPFNPHMLMVRSLALMRDLSPDYLHRFMQHADTLLWLEQASARHGPMPSKTKTVKPVRIRK